VEKTGSSATLRAGQLPTQFGDKLGEIGEIGEEREVATATQGPIVEHVRFDASFQQQKSAPTSVDEGQLDVAIQSSVTDELLRLLMLWLNERTKMAPSLVIRCPGLAVGVSATRVVTLPLHWLSRGDPL